MEAMLDKQDATSKAQEVFNELGKESNDVFGSMLDGFTSKVDSLPGGKFLRTKLGLGDKDISQVKTGFGDGISKFADMKMSGKGFGESLKGGMGAFKKSVPNLGKMLKMGGPLIAMGALVAIGLKFGAKIDAIGEQFGNLKVLGNDFKNEILGAESSAVRLGFEIKDIASVTNILASNFGISLITC